MPTNLYGPNDNFDLVNSHVFPALISRFHEAKINNAPEVVVWGTGKVRREFLFVDDMAAGCLFLLENFNPSKEQNERGDIFTNLGVSRDYTIKELSELIKSTIGYDGKIAWDTTKLDGTPQKLLDTKKIHELGWKHKTELEEGLKQTYQWYVAQRITHNA